MLSKGNLVIIFIFILPLIASAQQSDNGYFVSSYPTGAEVSLEGDIIVSGVSPVGFTQGLLGTYQVRIRKFGYETYRSTVYLQPDRAISLFVDLKRKTRLKALARSMIIPGWGQIYSGQNTKGVGFLIFTVLATGAYLLTDDEYDYRVGIYESDLAAYQAAIGYDEKKLLYSTMSDSRKNAYRAETERRIAIGAVAVGWGLNILDLILHYPEADGSLIGNSLSLRPDWDNGGATLVLSHRF